MTSERENILYFMKSFFLGCCSVAQSCLTLCDPMDCSTPGLPVLHYLLEFAQTHVHWISDAIQRSPPRLPPSPPALNLSQHQGLFKWVSPSSGGQSIGVSASTSVLPVSIQGWFPLGLTGLIFLQSKGLSRVFSSTTVQIKVSILKHSAFFKVQLSHLYMTTGKATGWLDGPLLAKWCLHFLIHCLGLL